MRNPCDDRSGFSLIRWGMVFFPEIYWLCHPLIDWSEIFKPIIPFRLFVMAKHDAIGNK